MARLIGLAVLATIGSAGPLESCYGIHYQLTLMPDGSGKFEVLISQKPGDEKDLKKTLDLLEFVEASAGISAFTAVKTEVKDGWRHSRFTAYFDDVDKVYYNADGAAQPEGKHHDECLHFKLERRGEGFALTMEDWVFCKFPGSTKEVPKDWDDIKKDSENVVTWTLTMPGLATKTEGFQRMEGRKAFYERSPKTISKFEDAVKWPISARRRVECGKSEVTDAEFAAFRAELTKAKIAWPKIREDLEAARKKESEKR